METKTLLFGSFLNEYDMFVLWKDKNWYKQLYEKKKEASPSCYGDTPDFWVTKWRRYFNLID